MRPGQRPRDRRHGTAGLTPARSRMTRPRRTVSAPTPPMTDGRPA